MHKIAIETRIVLWSARIHWSWILYSCLAAYDVTFSGASLYGHLSYVAAISGSVLLIVITWLRRPWARWMLIGGTICVPIFFHSFFDDYFGRRYSGALFLPAWVDRMEWPLLMSAWFFFSKPTKKYFQLSKTEQPHDSAIMQSAPEDQTPDT